MRQPPQIIQRPEIYGYRETDGPILVDVNDAEPLSQDLQVPGYGLPPRPEQLMTPLQAWARLCRGQPMGQKTMLGYNSGQAEAQLSMDTILTVGGQDGSDLDACQLAITLDPPRVIKAAFTGGGVTGQNQQNTTGSYDNVGIGSADFPGIGTPIKWVPTIAVIEWGLGGTRRRAEVDFVQGAVVNITAAWARVFAGISTDAAVNAPGTSGLYELSANIGPGWPKPGSAQRTVYLGTIDNNAESGVFAVPPYAKTVTIMALDDTAIGTAAVTLTAASIRFWQSPAGQPSLTNVGNFFQAGNVPGLFRVPNGGAYFTVQQQMGANFKFAAVFELSI